MSTIDQPTETELKLRIAPDARTRLEQHPAFQAPRASQPEERDEITTYFDTPGLALNGRDMTLRIRRCGEKLIQTVKTSGGRDGPAMQRGEWEWAVSGDTPDIEKVVESPVGTAVRIADLRKLRPICSTRVHRTTWRIHYGGALAEAALDRGTIVSGNQCEPISELELELKSGDPATLHHLALDLLTVVPLAIEPESKAARGYRLLTGQRPRAHRPAPIDWGARVPAAEAFARIISSIVTHMLANLGAIDPAGPEAVHQLRAAVRRMRTAIILFRPCLHAGTVRRFNGELRRIGRVFGEARDWDVFALEILPAAQGKVPAAGGWLDLLRQAAEVKRADAYRAAREELHGPGFTSLLLGVAALAEQGQRAPALFGDAGMARTIGDLQSRLLDRMARAVLRRGNAFAKASREDLHALRKSTKKLRYSIEFLRGESLNGAAGPYHRACVKLAKRLGDLNDAVVAPMLAARLSEGRLPDLAPAIGLLEEWGHKAADRAKKRVPKAWRAFRAADPFW